MLAYWSWRGGKAGVVVRQVGDARELRVRRTSFGLRSSVRLRWVVTYRAKGVRRIDELVDYFMRQAHLQTKCSTGGRGDGASWIVKTPDASLDYGVRIYGSEKEECRRFNSSMRELFAMAHLDCTGWCFHPEEQRSGVMRCKYDDPARCPPPCEEQAYGNCLPRTR